MSNILRTFTEAVVAAEQKKTGVSSGYVTSEGREYLSYMDNGSWNGMLERMNAEHRSQYNAGGGGELREERGRPPKMASFISSSRMIYQLSKDIPGFVFETKRPTIVGGTANLDGYLACDGAVCYVEAKLREPYSHQPIQKVKLNYQPVYAWLRERMSGTFDCVMEARDEREMDVVFLNRGSLVSGFDIKQMVCHLLGIAAHHLKQEAVPETVSFLYLLYDPSALSFDGQQGEEILRIHQETAQAAQRYDFELMFGHIVDYLVNCFELPNGNAQALKEAFHFRLCDQNTYRSCF